MPTTVFENLDNLLEELENIRFSSKLNEGVDFHTVDGQITYVAFNGMVSTYLDFILIFLLSECDEYKVHNRQLNKNKAINYNQTNLVLVTNSVLVVDRNFMSDVNNRLKQLNPNFDLGEHNSHYFWMTALVDNWLNGFESTIDVIDFLKNIQRVYDIA